jgi:Protein of unknown function (DUF1553)/Protein of unknown function (DUF1549)
MLRLIVLLVVAAPAPAAEKPVSFTNDVIAVLSRSGCNAGACHGNLNGRGGLKLSLRGDDPEADRIALTRGQLGRRADVLTPDESLLLKKATGQVPHEGGVRFSAKSREYALMRDWIAAGGTADPPGVPHPVKLVVNGQSHVLVEPTDRMVIRATATFSDGSSHEVTQLLSFEMNNVGVATVKPSGEVVREQLGETVVIARYLNLQLPVRIAFLPNRPATDLSKLPANNDIDRLVNANLARLRMTPSEPSSDSVFIRRVYLDACGIIPTAAEAQSFLADTRPDKRAKLIDALVDRPEFASFWAQKWGDLLRNEEKSLDRKGVQVFHRWIKDWLAADKPLTDFAREIVSARGNTYSHPPANFYRAIRDPYLRAESVAQVFLGLRVSCAKCHNHPFDVWTQDDYHRFAGAFARIDYRVLENKRKDDLDKHEFVGEQIVFTKDGGELDHPRGGKALPKILGGKALDSGDRLTAVADWIADPTNPFFARAQANRVWAHLLGRGVVDPIDDFKTANPPTNPELLDHLAAKFRDGGFRLKPLVRHILNSRTYQLSATPNATNATDETHFSRALVQPLEAEQLLDAVTTALGTTVKFPGYPAGTRAGELPAPPQTGRRNESTTGSRFLKVFGKPDRLLTCECERSEDPGMLQAFQLLTGELLHTQLKEPDNRLGRMLGEKRGDTEMLDALYLSCLARYPTEAERTKLLAFVTANADRRAAWEDVTWGLLNAKEFQLRR